MAIVDDTITLRGVGSHRHATTSARIKWTIAALVIIFCIICARLVQLGYVVTETTIEGQERSIISATRPPILDRNGMEIATDIRVPSLFAEPRRIIDIDEAVEKLLTVLPDMDPVSLRKKLSGDRGFVWIKRELTPALQAKIMDLGLPGLDFLTESKRFYPGGPEASHIVGTVDIDNQGISGMERSLDQQDVALLQSIGLARGQDLTPVKLSIDLRVQHAMHAELEDALTRYKAISASGVMLDIKTGEVLGMVSLPDFDPNDPASALQEGRLNRITGAAFELGSTFKTVSFAGALDSGLVKLSDTFDARFGVKFGRFTITDFHGQHRILTLPEIYQYSSNVGTIKMVQQMGKDAFRDFLTRIGFDQPLVTELPEKARPHVPAKFSDIVAATASFGHGLTITPMHMAAAMSAFVNDGMYVTPTFYPRTEEQAAALSHRVISSHTSDQIRYLMRFNAIQGSGSRPNKIADGYHIGGKTGTAEKVVNGRYSATKNLNVFALAFPMEKPRYSLLIIVDEPQAENVQSGRTAAFNAGDVSGRIVQRVAPMLGIAPNFDPLIDEKLLTVPR